MIAGMRLALKMIFLAMIIILSGCASTLDQDGALAIAPYHVVNDGRIVVEARVNDQGPFNFALDTGSSSTVVFDLLRKELELEPVPGIRAIVHGVAASGQFPVVRISRIQVGREIWADATIVSLPGETAAVSRFDGILGIDFLERYAVGFSAVDRVLRLYPPDLVRERSYRGWASVPLELVSIGEMDVALYFFEIEIGGQRMPALFDLGAGPNMMNWPAARSLGIAPVAPGRDDLLSGALESTPIVAQLNAAEVRTARIRWRNEVFAIADLDVFATLRHGDSPLAILGSGLFNQRDFVIDFVRNRLLVNVAMGETDN
ncbi:MAG: aspartyl protease family protein [Woeseia sp.]